MPSQTNEQALEAAIQKRLAGVTEEELKDQHPGNIAEAAEPYRSGNGFWLGSHYDYNREYSLDERRFWHFLEETQSEELDKLRDQPQWELKIIQRLDRVIKRHGVIYVLRNGLEVDDASFTLMFPAPLINSSDDIKNAFEQNEFSVSRQISYSNANPREELDVVIFINGLPIITMELKNPWTHQTARVHGIKTIQEGPGPGTAIVAVWPLYRPYGCRYG